MWLFKKKNKPKKVRQQEKSFSERLKGSRKSLYEVEAHIYHKDRAVSRIFLTTKGYSRGKVLNDLSEELQIKVTDVKRKKKK